MLGQVIRAELTDIHFELELFVKRVVDMNISQKEFTSKIYDVIKDKIFIPNISGMPVTVVQKLPEQIMPGKVLFDGLTLPRLIYLWIWNMVS